MLSEMIFVSFSKYRLAFDLGVYDERFFAGANAVLVREDAVFTLT